MNNETITISMKKYNVTDGNADLEIEAETPLAACEEYVTGGDWGNEPKTSWVTITATEIVEPRYDASGVDGYGFLRDMRDSAPESRCPEVDLTDMSAEDRDAICVYLRSDDGSLPEEDQELCGEIADEIENLEAPEPESETHTIEIPPSEPDCCGGAHAWKSPLSVVGGIKENPGVYGNGGGVIMTEVCCYCGCYQVANTWAQNPENGAQGLTSVEYRDSDESSEAWLTRRQETAEKWVQEHSNEDDLDADDLEENFAKYFRRPADDDDRTAGLWSLLCAAVGCVDSEA